MGLTKALNDFNDGIRDISTRLENLHHWLGMLRDYTVQHFGQKQFEDHVGNAQTFMISMREKFLKMIVDIISLFELYIRLDAGDKEIILRNFSRQAASHIPKNLFNLKLTLTKFHVELFGLQQLLANELKYITDRAAQAWRQIGRARRESQREYDEIQRAYNEIQRESDRDKEKVLVASQAIEECSMTARRIFAMVKLFEALREDSRKVEDIMDVNDKPADELYYVMRAKTEAIISTCKSVLPRM
jgi:hypothetical protein